MGCDIHVILEKKVPVYTGHNLFEENNPYRVTPDEPHLFWWAQVDEEIYRGRSYSLFSILADVRNYGRDITPLDEPRGVPADASPDFLRMVNRWDGDGHSHSWVTLRDLVEFDWTQTVTEDQIMTVGNWVSWQESLKWSDPDARPKDAFFHDPNCPSLGVVSRGPECILTLEEVQRTYQDLNTANDWEAIRAMRGNQDKYVVAPVVLPYYAIVPITFMTRTLSIMHREAQGDLDSVRLCFFFDN